MKHRGPQRDVGAVSSTNELLLTLHGGHADEWGRGLAAMELATRDGDEVVNVLASVRSLVSMLGSAQAGVVAELLAARGWVPEKDVDRAAFAVARREWDRCVEIGEASVPVLIDTATDAREWVRQRSIRALGLILDRRAEGVVFDALQH